MCISVRNIINIVNIIIIIIISSSSIAGYRVLAAWPL